MKRLHPAHELRDPKIQRERILAQDKRLLEAAARLATVIKTLPPEARYPDTEPRALLVGGFVRDALLGLHPKDADIEVYGVSPERLKQLLEQLYEKVDLVGDKFQILKVRLGNGIELDVSLPRRESKTGLTRKDFKIDGDPTMPIHEAARRRDFAMNALAADPLNGEVFDPFGGISDLVEKRIRVTDPGHFVEDELRVYRAVQFAARLNFTIEPASFKLMKDMVPDLKKLTKERVSDEIKKLLLKGERPSVGFELLRELGIIETYYPELHALIGTPQEPEWHPEGDVWIHTMMVIDASAKIIRESHRGFTDEEKLQVMLGALCHDLGKPLTTAMGEKDGVPRLRSLGHEEAGKEPTEQLLKHWAFGESIEHAAVMITTQHLKPGMLFLQKEKGALTDATYANALRKLIKRIHPMSWRVLVAASEADHRGRNIPGVDREPYLAGEQAAKMIREKQLDLEPTKPLLRGQDLLERGFTPGPKIGACIKRIENARDEGKISTREEALVYLDELLQG